MARQLNLQQYLGTKKRIEATSLVELANELKKIKAKFILVIKNTDFIRNLYENNFNYLYLH